MNKTNSTPLILIVEDKIENLQLIGNILKEYRKAIATNGNDAIRIAKELHPDLILLDLMLPDIDGYDVCEILQSNTYTSDIPIIFVSALSQKENLIKGFKMGGVDYVTKPFDPDELIARVKTHLELKHSKELIIHQNENLKRLMEDKNLFISIAAHDLKNPLKVILGFTKLIEQRFTSYSEYQILDFLKDIRESAESMLGIITNIVYFNSLDEGTEEIYIEDVNITELVNTVINEFSNIAFIKNIRLILKDYSPDYIIQTDLENLHQLLKNILSNAIKFSNFNTKVIINIDTYLDSEMKYSAYEENQLMDNTNDFIKIDIIDEGPGISEEELPLIYNKFTKLSNKPTGDETCTGLGLAIVKALAEILQISIECKSEINKGTTFSLIIPHYITNHS